MESLGRNASPSSSSMIALTSRTGTTKPHSFPSLTQSVNVTVTVLPHYSIRLKDHGWCCCSPISASASLSHEPVQVDLEEPISQSENQTPDEKDTIRVRFLLQKECSFGEQFVLVGDDSLLGSWDPDSGIPLDWSDGHLWGVELDMPVGKTIKYKFILKAIGGELLWQPDPDRVLETWRTNTKTTIVILEDWVDPHVQKIVEEDEQIDPSFVEQTNGSVVVKEDPEAVADSWLLSVANNLVRIGKVSMNAITKGSDADGDADADAIPGEKPVLSLIAENISIPHQEEIITSYNENARHQLVGESVIISQPTVEPAVLLSPSNGTVTNSTSIDIDGTLIPEEGVDVPVLVPGLSPVSNTPSEASVEGVADVKNPTLLEAKEEETLEDKNAPSGSENDGVLPNYMRYMQKLLSNIGLVTGLIVKKKT